MYVKVLVVLLALGAGYYIVQLIGDNAVLEETVKAERQALKSYSDEVLSDIQGYKVALGALTQGYQEADDEKSKLEKILSDGRLEDLARQNPSVVSSRINRATVKLFNSIESATSRSTRPAASSKASPDKNEKSGAGN